MIIVDILCLNSCLSLISKGKRDRKAYFFMSSEGFADKFAVRFLKYLGWEFIPLEYELTPDNNRMPLFDIRQDLDSFVDSCILPKMQKQINENNYFSPYEKKRILFFLEFLCKKELYRSIEALHVLQILRTEMGKLASVLLAKSQWSQELSAFFKTKGYDLDFYSLLFPCKLKRREWYLMDSQVIQSLSAKLAFPLKIMRLSFKLIGEIFNCIYFWLCKRLKSSIPPEIGRFDIAAHIPGYGRTEWFNDLFWKKELKGHGSRTLAILFGPLDKSAHDSYGYLADRWVTLNKFGVSPDVFPVFCWMFPFYPKILMRNLTRLLKSFKGTSIYYWFEIANLWIETSKMEALFALTGVKLFWTSTEGQELTSLAGALAINRLNGVCIGSTWSMIGFSEFGIYKNTVDLFFIWGDRHSKIYRKEACKALVISGYPGDFYLHNFTNRAGYLRQKWQKEYGAEVIICCYDNVMGNDIQHFISLVFAYFENLLRWVEEKPNKLLVIKSKHGLLNYPVSIARKLKLLQEQKKLVYESNKADLAPGLASDLVVSPGISTLASLLAAYGKRVILLDTNGINDANPLDLENIVYLRRPEEITYALEGWLSAGHKNTGNLTGSLLNRSRLDPFVDGCAYRRISGYISNLTSGLDEGLASDAAIHNANRAYSDRWGTDKVIIK